MDVNEGQSSKINIAKDKKSNSEICYKKEDCLLSKEDVYSSDDESFLPFNIIEIEEKYIVKIEVENESTELDSQTEDKFLEYAKDVKQEFHGLSDKYTSQFKDVIFEEKCIKIEQKQMKECSAPYDINIEDKEVKVKMETAEDESKIKKEDLTCDELKVKNVEHSGSEINSKLKKKKFRKHTRAESLSFQCDICMKKFKLESLMEFHKRIHTGGNPSECHICKKTFRVPYNLAAHLRIHSGEKPFECDICKKRFIESSNLTTHKRIHSGEKPYECELCEKRFIVSSHLKRHKLTHTGEKSFGCDICSKKFTRQSHAQTHMLTHTKEKAFKCGICTKSFATNSHLTSHKLTHSSERPYLCDVCDKTFLKKSYVNTHKKRVHAM